MRLKKHKIFTLWQFEREERWLNEMSNDGWQLISVGFCTYEFERGEPGKYIYRLQILESHPASDRGRSYVRFIEETGAETVGTMFRWVYFRKNAADGPFELFSDLATRIRHMRDLLVLTGLLGGVNLYNGISQLCIYLTGGYNSLVIAVLCTAVGLLGLWGVIALLRIRGRLVKAHSLYE